MVYTGITKLQSELYEGLGIGKGIGKLIRSCLGEIKECAKSFSVIGEELKKEVLPEVLLYLKMLPPYSTLRRLKQACEILFDNGNIYPIYPPNFILDSEDKEELEKAIGIGKAYSPYNPRDDPLFRPYTRESSGGGKVVAAIIAGLSILYLVGYFLEASKFGMDLVGGYVTRGRYEEDLPLTCKEILSGLESCRTHTDVYPKDSIHLMVETHSGGPLVGVDVKAKCWYLDDTKLELPTYVHPLEGNKIEVNIYPELAGSLSKGRIECAITGTTSPIPVTTEEIDVEIPMSG
jgi:hypothetical protein